MDRLFVSAFAILLTFSLHSSSAHAKRILFASQFSLIPVSQAHLTIGSAEGGELDPKSIKVLAWNIKKGQERGLDIDLPRLARDRDLVLISEGYLKPDLIKLFETKCQPPTGEYILYFRLFSSYPPHSYFIFI